MIGRALSILTVLFVIGVTWQVAVIPMNIHLAVTEAERSGLDVTPPTVLEREEIGGIRLAVTNPRAIPLTYELRRPRLPSPAQVATDFWENTAERSVTSRRSLVFHAWITLSATLNGFLLGGTIGILLAIGIVYSRTMELGVMPWAIISQTVPIVALAPMIIVVVASIGIEGRTLSKAIISAYLCFFPILVGMVAGLRSPDRMQLDLLSTYSATPAQVFWRLRLPASIPFLFASLKVGIAAALVGTIVGELPTGAVRGLGARILIGDQFGTPVQIWSALFATAILAGGLITLLGLVERALVRRRGGLA